MTKTLNEPVLLPEECSLSAEEITAGQESETHEHETEIENANSGVIQEEARDETAVHRTDLDDDADLRSEDMPSPETDLNLANNHPGSARGPKKRSKKSQSGESLEAAGGDTPQTPKKINEDDAPVAHPSSRQRAESVVSIDERRSVETEADRVRNDILDLVESLKSGKILTDTIKGVERSPDNPNLSFAVIYHGEIKVIIPVEEAVEPPEDFRDQSPADVMHYLLTKRLGAEVDYIVRGVDSESGIAAASRLQAMAVKRRQYYFGTDRDGNNLLYSGVCAEARVVSTIRSGIFVDIFGLEVYIPLRELSYQRWIDASSHFQPGQRVLVKILSIDRTDRTHIAVTASVKQAGENPYEKALRKYSVGNRYVGTVSMVDVNGVFVSLDGGIDCLCQHPKRGRPPRNARVTVRILGIDQENNRIWGVITHISSVK